MGYRDCTVCKAIAGVTVAPLYFGKKRKGWGFFFGAICPHAKRKMGYDSTSVQGAAKTIAELLEKPEE